MKLKTLLKNLNENKNIFFHISSDLSKDGYFFPRIPYITREDEDTNLNRVCVADSFNGTFTAIPNGAGNLDTYLEESSYYFKVFVIDTKKLGIKNIMTSEELYKKDYVRDAMITGEHWILEDFTVPDEDIFYIRLNNWTEEPEDIYPYEIYKLSETDEYEGDYVEAYYDTYQDDVPYMITIQNVQFDDCYLNTGECFEVDLESVESSLDKQDLKDKFLANHPNIEFIDVEDDDNIKILAKEDQDISLIMYLDWFYKHC